MADGRPAPRGARRAAAGLRAARARAVSRGGPGLGLLLRPGRGPAPSGSGQLRPPPVQPPRPPLQPPPRPCEAPPPALAISGPAPPPRPTNGAWSCGVRRRRGANQRRPCGGRRCSRRPAGRGRNSASRPPPAAFEDEFLESARCVRPTGPGPRFPIGPSQDTCTHGATPAARGAGGGFPLGGRPSADQEQARTGAGLPRTALHPAPSTQ
ncbi:proline-rich protein 2-like [Myotis yumanensis]|uniref:proline-rich protein 2-like n=1 Tax=Myotis yumanensis TaxID=159337 RepID=UPI0038D357AD